jgi:hypothetical protein
MDYPNVILAANRSKMRDLCGLRMRIQAILAYIHVAERKLAAGVF